MCRATLGREVVVGRCDARDRDLESRGKPHDRLEARIPGAALDVADVSRVQPSSAAQLLLGQPALGPDALYRLPEDTADIGGIGHRALDRPGPAV